MIDKEAYENKIGDSHTVTEYGRMDTIDTKVCIRPEYAKYGYPVKITNPFYIPPKYFSHVDGVIITKVEKVEEPTWELFHAFLRDKEVNDCWFSLGLSSFHLPPDHFFENPDLERYFGKKDDSETVVEYIQELLDEEKSETGYASLNDYRIAGWLWMLWRYKYLLATIKASEMILNKVTEPRMNIAPALAQQFLRK